MCETLGYSCEPVKEPTPKKLKSKTQAPRQDPQEVLDKLAEKIEDFKRQQRLQRGKGDVDNVPGSPMKRLSHKLDEISQLK